MGLVDSSDAPLTCIYEGGRVHYVGSTTIILRIQNLRKNLCRVMANEQDCDTEETEFEPRSRCHIRFRTNTFRKSMNPIISPSNRLNSTIAVLHQGLNNPVGIKQPSKVDVPLKQIKTKNEIFTRSEIVCLASLYDQIGKVPSLSDKLPKTFSRLILYSYIVASYLMVEEYKNQPIVVIKRIKDERN